MSQDKVEIIDLDEMERIGKAAVEAPWQQCNWAPCRIESVDNDGLIIYDEGGHRSADAAFIVAARNNWQAMIDELRELRAYRQEILGVHK